MKTLGLTVGLLLLLTVYYGSAIPHGVNELAPGRCCFNFFTGRLPQQQIIQVLKTHSRCQENGFVISAANGREICVSQNLSWAQRAFKQQRVTRN